MKPKVFLIGGVLLSVIAVSAYIFTGSISHGKYDKAKYDILSLSEHLEEYRAINRKCPPSEKGLDLLIGITAEGKSYLLSRIPKDPWGRDYRYLYPGKENKAGFDLWSFGADNKLSGDNENRDIYNW